MRPEDFDPKTFFAFHDLNGDGVWDQDEVKVSPLEVEEYFLVPPFLTLFLTRSILPCHHSSHPSAVSGLLWHFIYNISNITTFPDVV